ncbi:hypothetical protein ACQ4WX_41550 [Streptomyces lasalocidi]
MEPQEAWEELCGQFVRAFEAVADGDFEAVDDLEALRFGPALVTKSLATCFPDTSCPSTPAEHLRTFVALLGGSVRAGAPGVAPQEPSRRCTSASSNAAAEPGVCALSSAAATCRTRSSAPLSFQPPSNHDESASSGLRGVRTER